MQDTNVGVIRAAALAMQADPDSAVAIDHSRCQQENRYCEACTTTEDHLRWCEETNLLGTYRRVVRIETSYLADALHALRNGSPEVTDEFLDRAILALTRLRAE